MISTHPGKVRMIRLGGSQVAHVLAGTDRSLDSQLECIHDQSDPDLVGHVIQLVSIQPNLRDARHFLPALHTHQIALWFNNA
jgi:hypothetical protein